MKKKSRPMASVHLLHTSLDREDHLLVLIRSVLMFLPYIRHAFQKFDGLMNRLCALITIVVMYID